MTQEFDDTPWEKVLNVSHHPEGVVQDGVTVFAEREYVSKNGYVYRIRDVKGENRWIECQYATKDKDGNTLASVPRRH
jgi:hypothetical protein